MWNKWHVLAAVVLVVCCRIRAADESSLGQQCASKLTAVMTCVAFATGKEAKPEQKCCDSVEEMKNSNPACLCFIILQIHNGTNPMLQKMNIQESRLLQLPSACKIVNASVTDCPKLLKLPSDSTDAAIFTSNSTIVPPTYGGLSSTTSTTAPLVSRAFKVDAPELIATTVIPLAFLLAISLESTVRL